MFSVKRFDIVASEARQGSDYKLAEPERIRLDAGTILVNTSQGCLAVVLLRVGLNLSGNTEGPIPQPWACVHLFPGYCLEAEESLEVNIAPSFPVQGYRLEVENA